jgi:hypothetical protein
MIIGYIVSADEAHLKGLPREIDDAFDDINDGYRAK